MEINFNIYQINAKIKVNLVIKIYIDEFKLEHNQCCLITANDYINTKTKHLLYFLLKKIQPSIVNA